MREILFRGKRVDNGEWVYGSFCMDAIEQFKGPCGLDGFIRLYDEAKGKMQMHEVDRETVGQYTGFADKNGERIFEGDILERGSRYRWLVSFKRCSFIANNAKDGRNRLSTRYWGSSQIIGNIHDNPELLERGVENAPAVR